MSKAEVLYNCPYLEPKDIAQCLNYAAASKKMFDKFADKLPIDAANKLQEHIKQSRDEWDM
jgi:hypothetical protein